MKGMPRSLSHAPKSRANVVKQIVPIKNVSVTVAGLSGVGFGGAVIGDLPQGNILLLGAVAYLQLSTADAGVIATFDGDFSIGSAPNADTALAGAEIDIIPSTALNPATAKLSPVVRATQATQAVLDNSDDSLELNLNVLIDDASISVNGAIFVANGYAVLSYVVLGDD